MKIKGISYYKDHEEATAFLEDWATRLQKLNSSWYENIIIHTSLGKTRVWGYNIDKEDVETIVVFPGFRTSVLFWDLDNALIELKKKYRIYLIETNGQPNLSDGGSPDIRSEDYGIWATEVLQQLAIKKASILGASFGAIVCMKLCLVSPDMVNRAILLSPAGLTSFSLALSNLYYNFLPILLKSKASVRQFIDKVALHPPVHNLSMHHKQLLEDYILFILLNFRNNAALPQPMKYDELRAIETEIHLVLGEKDQLFPYRKNMKIAQKHIQALGEVYVVSDSGHGIETSREATRIVERILTAYRTEILTSQTK